MDELVKGSPNHEGVLPFNTVFALKADKRKWLGVEDQIIQQLHTTSSSLIVRNQDGCWMDVEPDRLVEGLANGKCKTGANVLKHVPSLQSL